MFGSRATTRVFLRSGGPLFLEPHRRPEAFSNQRPRQPVHRQTKVVEHPQVNIRTDGAGLETRQQMLGLRLHDDPVTQAVQGLVFSQRTATAAVSSPASIQ